MLLGLVTMHSGCIVIYLIVDRFKSLSLSRLSLISLVSFSFLFRFSHFPLSCLSHLFLSSFSLIYFSSLSTRKKQDEKVRDKKDTRKKRKKEEKEECDVTPSAPLSQGQRPGRGGHLGRGPRLFRSEFNPYYLIYHCFFFFLLCRILLSPQDRGGVAERMAA